PESLAELAVAVAEAVSRDAAPVINRLEGVASVWDQLSRTDLDRVKRELGLRRAELLTRHAEELRALDAEQSEIDAFEEAVDVLRARAEAAAEIDDALAAETWHKAADAAARKLRDSPGPK